MISIRRSFSAKVSLAVLLLAVTIFLASVGILFRQSRKMIRSESVDRATGVLTNAMHRINRYLITAETATKTHAGFVEEALQSESLQGYTNQILRLNPYVDGCVIGTEPGVLPTYPDGFMAVSIRDNNDISTAIETGYNYFSKRWYSIPRTQKRPCWVVAHDEENTLDLNDEGMIATYSHPLFNKDKQFIGIISTEMSLLHISQILAQERPYPHSYYVLIDEQGRYVGHPDSTRLFSKTIFSVADPKRQSDLITLGYEMTKGNQGNMSVRINNTRALVCYMPVAGTTWSLAIVCPDSDILRGYNRITYIVISLIIIGLLLIYINCHKTVAVSLQPLKDLLEKAQAVTGGNLGVKIEHTERTDVIGDLQNSFATMLQSLNYYITNVHTATEQTKIYNRELEHATKLAMEAEQQKTIFIQNVSHQIRTPLNIIMGFAQVLNSPNDKNSLYAELGEEEIKSIASAMGHNSRLLIRMVMMLFDSSDNGLAESEKCNKCELVACNEMCREARLFIANHHPNVPISFKTEISDDFCIETNRRFLIFSIEELLNNAARYSDQQNVTLFVEKDYKSIRFIIQDTGKGITEAHREHIFKFFTKIDEFSEGLGLGLPLTKRHAKNLGGNLILDTAYTAGCRFIFELPITIK